MPSLIQTASLPKTWNTVPKRNGITVLVKSPGGVLTVRFTYRDEIIRIFGAGYWRKGKTIYDRENKVHE